MLIERHYLNAVMAYLKQVENVIIWQISNEAF